jgi:hypothetical protein
MLDVLDTGPDCLADDGQMQKKPDADVYECGDDDDNQAVDWSVCPDDIDLGRDGTLYRARHQPPEKFNSAYRVSPFPY